MDTVTLELFTYMFILVKEISIIRAQHILCSQITSKIKFRV